MRRSLGAGGRNDDKVINALSRLPESEKVCLLFDFLSKQLRSKFLHASYSHVLAVKLT